MARRYLEPTPNTTGIDRNVYDELLKIYKAIGRMGIDIDDLTQSQPVPLPDPNQVVVNAFAVTVNGETVYATPS